MNTEKPNAAMQATIDRVHQSYGRALMNPKLIERFYKIFMDSSPQIRAKFVDTDFDTQYELLNQGISMAILFPMENVIAKQAISRLQTRHNRDNLDINPQLYGYWVDSLMLTLEESDPQFDEDLEQDWRQLLQVTIDHLSEGH